MTPNTVGLSHNRDSLKSARRDFGSWVLAHSCWRKTPQHDASMGKLSELRDRNHCKTCQSTYRLIEKKGSLKSNIPEVVDGLDCFIHCDWIMDEINIKASTACNSLYINVSLETIGGVHDERIVIDPLWIDTKEMQDWVKDCDNNHQSCRKFQAREQKKFKALFVDTALYSLVDIVTPDSYVALSYVWGRNASFQTMRSNIDALKVQGALKKCWTSISATLRDAILLTAHLGFRYVWIDQLSIVQDDPEHKRKHIEKMGYIYAQASITIIAADGTHADYGLGGVLGGTPRHHAPQSAIPFTPRSQQLAEPQSLLTQNELVYYTRGWTYQEYHLSPRILVFVDSKVRWKCHTGEYREGIRALSQSTQWHMDEQNMKTPLQWPNLTFYSKMVEDYNQRDLGFDSDVLPAFSGMLDQLATVFQSGFIQGLPGLFFDVALLWQPAKPIRRRKSPENNHSFPSWSWVGWQGDLDLDLWRQGLSNPLLKSHLNPVEFQGYVQPVTSWSSSNSAPGERHVIDNSYNFYYNLRLPGPQIEGVRPIPAPSPTQEIYGLHSNNLNLQGWEVASHTCSVWFDDDVSWPCYKHKTLTGRFLYPLPIPTSTTPSPFVEDEFLHFKSSRAMFNFGASINSSFQNHKRIITPSYTLVDKAGHLSGIVRLQTDEDLQLGQRLHEFIAISKGQAYLDDHNTRNILEEVGDIMCLNRIAELYGYLGRVSMFGEAAKPPKNRDEETQSVFDRLKTVSQGMGPYEWYNVLWVEWQDGIAYRKGLGRVFKQVWEVQALERVDVILG